jgi:hypothetical protein
MQRRGEVRKQKSKKGKKAREAKKWGGRRRKRERRFGNGTGTAVTCRCNVMVWWRGQDGSGDALKRAPTYDHRGLAREARRVVTEFGENESPPRRGVA